MKLHNTIRKHLKRDVLLTWEQRSKLSEKTSKLSDFLTDKKNGPPKKKDEPQWSIRDCMLNDKKVCEYIKYDHAFRGKNINEKIAKFNGYKFYQCIYLENNDCSLSYLNVYSVFVGYQDFRDYILSTKNHFNKDDVLVQVSEIDEERGVKADTKKNLGFKKIKYFEIPHHLFAYYSGYFLRPRKPKINNKSFSKLSLLLCDDNTAFLKTTGLSQSDEFETKYYSGFCSRINVNILQIDFQISDHDKNTYKFSFVMDIQTRKEKEVFNEYRILRGVMCGSDVTTGKPFAGRLILQQEKDWKSLLELNATRNKIIDDFIQQDNCTPEDLDNLALERLFEKKEVKRNLIREFFTIEERYLENINFLKKYIRNPNIYNAVHGDYSIYTLDSSAEEVKRGQLRIESWGEVHIKGRKISADERRQFHGWATILKDDVLSVIVNTEKDGTEIENDETISYLMKLYVDSVKNNFDLINGVRITKSSDQRPYGGRVVFIKEESGFFDSDNLNANIKLFDCRTDLEKEVLTAFKKLYKGAVYSLLLGFENNLIKTFGPKRQRMGFKRDIDYKENYFNLARFHAIKKTKETAFELVFLNLYYSYIHGNLDIYQRILEEVDFKDFIVDPYFNKVIQYKESQIIFDETEILIINLSLLRN